MNLYIYIYQPVNHIAHSLYKPPTSCRTFLVAIRSRIWLQVKAPRRVKFSASQLWPMTTLFIELEGRNPAQGGESSCPCFPFDQIKYPYISSNSFSFRTPSAKTIPVRHFLNFRSKPWRPPVGDFSMHSSFSQRLQFTPKLLLKQLLWHYGFSKDM